MKVPEIRPVPIFRRAVIIVLDGVGIGELPDAGLFGDAGADTLGNTARAAGGLDLPWFGRLGLGNIAPIEGVPPDAAPSAAWGKMAEAGPAKDTTSGHWELMGVRLARPFPVYPGGFPPEVIAAVERAVGRRVLGNIPASGTGILERFGEEHLAGGALIVYTSADSVFQVAAHEDVIPAEDLHAICRRIRGLLRGEHEVGRVIARPFTGRPGAFIRTPRRRDFSVPPPAPTLLDIASGRGLPVTGIGKIDDIFTGRGLNTAVHTASNEEGLAATLEAMRRRERGIILTNLVDFDTLWGHRNDAAGLAAALAAADAWVPRLLEALGEGDILVFTADHGCDPTTPSTDHTREHVPLLMAGPGLARVNLGRRETFADLAATLAELLGLGPLGEGKSFADLVHLGPRS